MLLLEAGGSDRNVLFSVPAGFAKMTKGIASWGCLSVPQRQMQNRFVLAERLPGSDINSDADPINFACKHAKTDHHPVGICKMGRDNMAVVSPQLKLHGLDGLRIADASVMPLITSGNTNAPTIMIAEKAADLIKHN